MHPVHDSPLLDLLDFDPHLDVPLDLMHNVESGLFKAMLAWLELYIAALSATPAAASKYCQAIADRFREFAAARHPGVAPQQAGIFPVTNYTASRCRAVAQDLPFALYGVLPDNNAATRAFVAFNNMYDLLRLRSFTEEDLGNLPTCIEDFRAAISIFQPFSSSNFKFRKLHLSKHWPACIRRHGAPYLYSAEANEMFHKTGAKVRPHRPI